MDRGDLDGKHTVRQAKERLNGYTVSRQKKRMKGTEGDREAAREQESSKNGLTGALLARSGIRCASQRCVFV